MGKSIIFIFPAYSANAVPVIFGGGLALDFGKTFTDDRPILGSHKTFRGFIAGLAIGTLVGIGESYLFDGYSPFLGFVLSLGALVGDLAGAFLKRRLGLTPGTSLPIVDQIDFVLGALLLSSTINPISPVMVLLIVLLTIPVHIFTNFLAYLTHAKKKPW
ncbi:MAG: CDP-2,3-bis-(O-geranylgeranyl)-sn-glycerol synthase [Candidatus Bathyarchaeota archaeon]|nr:CDP-2,3-bis-(O-geranylgeranyl)-sn-glycerol synthase [Candidatus Bathyarchaeota archaeon]